MSHYLLFLYLMSITSQQRIEFFITRLRVYRNIFNYKFTNLDMEIFQIFKDHNSKQSWTLLSDDFRFLLLTLFVSMMARSTIAIIALRDFLFISAGFLLLLVTPDSMLMILRVTSTIEDFLSEPCTSSLTITEHRTSSMFLFRIEVFFLSKCASLLFIDTSCRFSIFNVAIFTGI